MKIEKFSRKAQEKFADSLFSMSNLLFSGVLATLLIGPMAAVFRLMFTPDDERASLWVAIQQLPSSEALVFIALYVAVVLLGCYGRFAGMRIYSRLHPDEG
nr:hypothetical protein [uncultured Pseudoxanthomonas sp.]